MPEIYINHSGAGNAVESMTAENQYIRQVLTELQQSLNARIAEWAGQDREVYTTQVQPAWERQVANLAQIIQQHGSVLDNISSNYYRTDLSNAQGFGDIRM
ncbi:WXG100 family type VII secretion target [Streptomyces sp. NPDC093252]|uniref:WXG100 family type VII secretion target n=1 Tax=Streptomyces sp. NPDC093252 TaxID=3154980 RepID=UPI003430E03B